MLNKLINKYFKTIQTCSLLSDLGFHLYCHVMSFLSQLKYFSIYEFCETAFIICLKRKESILGPLIAMKKVSYQPVKNFVGHGKKFYKCSDNLLGAYFFPSLKVT